MEFLLVQLSAGDKNRWGHENWRKSWFFKFGNFVQRLNPVLCQKCSFWLKCLNRFPVLMMFIMDLMLSRNTRISMNFKRNKLSVPVVSTLLALLFFPEVPPPRPPPSPHPTPPPLPTPPLKWFFWTESMLFRFVRSASYADKIVSAVQVFMYTYANYHDSKQFCCVHQRACIPRSTVGKQRHRKPLSLWPPPPPPPPPPPTHTHTHTHTERHWRSRLAQH